jgi:uncharacterized membrane protein YqaE (UPF0057 family)
MGMSCGRAILCIILPPIAVIDLGCAAFLIVCVLTLAGWIPGALAALVLNALFDPAETNPNPKPKPKGKGKGKRKRKGDDFDFD